MWGSSPLSADASPPNRDAVMMNVKQQIALANAQELLQVSRTLFHARRLNRNWCFAASQRQVRAQMSRKAQRCIGQTGKGCVFKCAPKNKRVRRVQQCLSSCMDRFMESWTSVSGAYQQRLQHEAAVGGGMAAYEWSHICSASRYVRLYTHTFVLHLTINLGRSFC